MKYPQRTSSSVRLTAQACVLALAFLSGPVAHATGAPAAVSSAASVVDAATAKKIAARAQAEKQRAIREARELEVLANEDQPKELDSLAATATKPVAQPAKLSIDAATQVQALSARYGIKVDASARTAGYLTGLVGAWRQELPPGSAPIALSSEEYLSLAVEYAKAEKAGFFSRFALGGVFGAGLLYLTLKFMSRRKSRVSRLNRPAAKPTRASDKPNSTGKSMFSLFGRRKKATDKQEPTQAVVVAFDMDTLRDYAFNLLFARGRHDLAGVGDMVTPGFARLLQNHFLALEAKGHWNKVERVCGVKCEEIESWVEGDTSFAKLHVSWKALDYVVNYNRRPGEHGYLVEGDSSRMESFEEEWVVTRRAGDAWLVDASYPAGARPRK